MRALFVISCVLLSLAVDAQFFQGFGAMGGITYGREKWWVPTIDGSSTAEKHKFLLRFNGELYAEFIDHDVFRWRTEFEYDMKGTKHKVTGNRNKLDYISWNNYLVIRGETYSGYPYFLIGPRVEYTFKQNTPDVPYAFKPFHFSWSAGIGWEFITYGNFIPLVELHYNPDIDRALNQTIALEENRFGIKNRAWELRVGFVIRFNNKDCPKALK